MKNKEKNVAKKVDVGNDDIGFCCGVPVMICAFNRPDTLRLVLEAVRSVRPVSLYLVLDAPREGNECDAVGVSMCREIFETNIDWTCEIHRNYATTNMGCGKRMTSGISWVFAHEERAIILEDDCVPHSSFFRFCEELLERYKDDFRVGMIAGECEHFRKAKMDFRGDSYYFDRMTTISAGWATWRRAWNLHDPTLKCLDRMIETQVMYGVLRRQTYVKRWRKDAMRIRDGKFKVWAAAWATTVYRENMLVAHPVVDPSVNVGHGISSRDGANGDVFLSPVAWKPVAEEIAFPLHHPSTMMPNVLCEKYCLEDLLYRAAWKKVLSNPILAWKRIWRHMMVLWSAIKRRGWLIAR